VARAKHTRTELTDLLGRRPGWRLEPRTTPGASPSWCFVAGGEVEFSVTADGGLIRLYVMATDEEMQFADCGALSAWLQANRAEAMQGAPPRQDRASRFKNIFEW